MKPSLTLLPLCSYICPLLAVPLLHCAHTLLRFDVRRRLTGLEKRNELTPQGTVRCLLRLAVPGKYGHKWARWFRRVQLIADERQPHRETRGLPGRSASLLTRF